MKNLIIRAAFSAACVSIVVPLLLGDEFTQTSKEHRLPIIKFVEPDFPGGMSLIGVTSGHAVIGVSVDSSGKVTDAYSTEFTHRRFADESIAAIRGWVFEPDESGSPLPRFYPVRINYRIEGIILVMTAVEDSKARMLPERPVFMSYSIEKLDRIPDQKNAPMPIYPTELRSDRKTGVVEVQFYIDSSGKVRVPFVRQSDDPLFAKAAMEAVRNWSFESPTRNGRPVSAFAVQEFSFGPRPMLN